ncbi:hypothetical protein BDY21DRAFT_55879 [Lineolata rhizophorae]|uniref:Nephrocystin 3-like N-terminal domain-containing protein n=1 Tax=Lineolata rhizophorae TaxID=578093 RepID=A0A6A6NX98_9PEZI|nr:hypothetical protein BDY21DRAFT_55879 [Lineolata rhizophorae]
MASERLWFILAGRESWVGKVHAHEIHFRAQEDSGHPFRMGQAGIPSDIEIFFWRLGTSFEKSVDGLLRSVLFEIINYAPEIVSGLLPETDPRNSWAYAPAGPLLGESTFAPLNRTSSGLLDLLKKAKALSTKYKFCLFIDGLDEIQGDITDLLKTLNELISSNVKICVSSRPWNEFEIEFRQCEKQTMYLHELTKPDIRKYVHEVLDIQRNPEAFGLVQDVVTKANGVFLWVDLVTRSLRNGHANGDSITELRRRLGELPADLDELYKYILDSIDPRYVKETKTYLWCALSSERSLPLLLFLFLSNLETDQFLAEHTNQLISTAKRRVNSRCKDLVSIKHSHMKSYSTLVVEFSHKSVSEFLYRHYGQIPFDKSFDPLVETMEASLAAIELLLDVSSATVEVYGISHFFLDLVAQADRSWKPQNSYLDRFCSVVLSSPSLLEKLGIDSIVCPLYEKQPSTTVFIEVAEKYRLVNCMRKRLETLPALGERSSSQLLQMFSSRNDCSPTQRTRTVDLDIFRHLLKQGTDPHEVLPGRTWSAWRHFIQASFWALSREARSRNVREWRIIVIKEFLLHGANPHIIVEGSRERGSSRNEGGHRTLLTISKMLDYIKLVDSNSGSSELIGEVEDIFTQKTEEWDRVRSGRGCRILPG